MDIEQDSHAPASKESRNFIGERRVEVIGNPDFPFQIAGPANRSLRFVGNEPRHRFISPGDNDLFSLLDLVQKTGEVGFRLVRVDNRNCRTSISLVPFYCAPLGLSTILNALQLEHYGAFLN